MNRFIPPLIWPVEIIPGLFQSGMIFSSSAIRKHQIKVVIDLHGGFDPKRIAHHLDYYLYWPIEDASLPDLLQLHQTASFGHWCHAIGMKVLTHCQLGLNRSSLVNGMILWKWGYRGKEITHIIRRAVPLALRNKKFKHYLEQL